MAIPELTEKISFEDKPDKERDTILRDRVLGLFLENELLTERVERIEAKLQERPILFSARERLNQHNGRIAELERKIGILQNKCKVSFL